MITEKFLEEMILDVYNWNELALNTTFDYDVEHNMFCTEFFKLLDPTNTKYKSAEAVIGCMFIALGTAYKRTVTQDCILKEYKRGKSKQIQKSDLHILQASLSSSELGLIVARAILALYKTFEKKTQASSDIFEKCWRDIVESNMSKILSEGGLTYSRMHKGKVPPSEDYRAPNLAQYF